MDFPGSSVVKNPPASAGDARYAGLICALGRSPRGGHGNPLQYSCLENPMNRGAWWAIVPGVAQSRMWLSNGACVHRDGAERACAQVSLCTQGNVPVGHTRGGMYAHPIPFHFSLMLMLTVV